MADETFKDKEKEMRIFVNKFKEKDTHHDFRALFTIDGKEFVANLYKRKSKDGADYLGGKIHSKEEATAYVEGKKAEAAGKTKDENSGFPFN
jgi:hypothetical protein